MPFSPVLHKSYIITGAGEYHPLKFFLKKLFQEIIPSTYWVFSSCQGDLQSILHGLSYITHANQPCEIGTIIIILFTDEETETKGVK